MCSIKMDSWIFNFSYYFNYTWVNIYNFNFLKNNFLFIRIFIPELATLPADNSTSEWDNVKYLFNHFNSTSN
jgi:hypothetical protein